MCYGCVTGRGRGCLHTLNNLALFVGQPGEVGEVGGLVFSEAACDERRACRSVPGVNAQLEASGLRPGTGALHTLRKLDVAAERLFKRRVNVPSELLQAVLAISLWQFLLMQKYLYFRLWG